jgi:DNA-binding MarR family transcriptional regulator
VNKSTGEKNRAIASRLSNNLPRLLREFSRDFEQRIGQGLAMRGHHGIRSSHSAVFANLGTGAVRVTELAERARVTQQAMGKMLKEMERMGYVARDIDSGDKRAREIRLTDKGIALVRDCEAVVEAVRSHYASKAGEAQLVQLEECLRHAIGKLEFDYLPRSWADSGGPEFPADA